MAGDGGKQRETTENSGRRRKTAGDGMGRWGTALHSDVWGKFRKRPDGTTECRPSSSSNPTYRATLENDRTGRQLPSVLVLAQDGRTAPLRTLERTVDSLAGSGGPVEVLAGTAGAVEWLEGSERMVESLERTGRMEGSLGGTSSERTVESLTGSGRTVELKNSSISVQSFLAWNKCKVAERSPINGFFNLAR